jgi:hypothetical protein
MQTLLAKNIRPPKNASQKMPLRAWASANELDVDMRATTDRATLVNLAQHSYFNLGGIASGSVAEQELTLFADQYTPGDPLIPGGRVLVTASLYQLNGSGGSGGDQPGLVGRAGLGRARVEHRQSRQLRERPLERGAADGQLPLLPGLGLLELLATAGRFNFLFP